jgi:hypothetical protein
MHLVHTYIAYRVSISVVYIVVVSLCVPHRHIYPCVQIMHTDPLTRTLTFGLYFNFNSSNTLADVIV